MPRPKIERDAIFRMLALNHTKKKIKRDLEISERTYWRIKAKFDTMTISEREAIKSDATQEEKAKEKFEDYEFVQKWIATMKAERIRSWKNRLSSCRRVWVILQKKNPENWTIDDIKIRAIPILREKAPRTIFHYLVALRSLRPDLKEELKTKREKAQPRFEWKYAFERIAQDRKTLQNFFESAKREDLDEKEISLEPQDCECLVRVHVTVGGREGGRGKGGIINIEWNRINWERKTIDWYESKTGGGFYWLDCPLDLFGESAFDMLKDRWERLGNPKEGKVFPITYNELRAIYFRISKGLEEKEVKPHFARKLHACLLIRQEVPMEIVAGDSPHGLMGIGWEDLSTLKKYYLTFLGKTIMTQRNKAKELKL